MADLHQHFTLKATGLWICQDHPYIGVTPDALSFYSCHGTGCVEVKCPFSVREEVLADQNQTNFCLETSDGKLSLKKNRRYWTQFQVQLHVTGLDFAHFVVGTTKDINIEKIDKDLQFFELQFPKVTEFFKYAILSELLGKWFSKPKENCSPSQQLFCYCRHMGDDDTLVLNCNGSSCACF